MVDPCAGPDTLVLTFQLCTASQPCRASRYSSSTERRHFSNCESSSAEAGGGDHPASDTKWACSEGVAPRHTDLRVCTSEGGVGAGL